MTVLVLRGVPYSGKSSYIRALPEPVDGEKLVFSADDFHRTPDGKYDFKPERAAEAHLWCFRRFTEACQRQPSQSLLIVDNTNIRLWEAAPYVMVGKAFYHSVKVVTFNVSMDEILRRREGRPEQVVPIAVIERMLKSFEPSPSFWETFELDPSIPRP